ncbi:Indole-3-pyruvate monooxygenase YUCCA1 [Psilocybe cubensis]|uniref:Indole-3-pyruvate monooxygenase YUCCA1 n=2 Tax=Psilocybe cubensis TaxID=181762 RepID=A0ACB8H9P3_PSICU|nr:Indole-3-pyruvate monooxygenase YUCCA1 [Psilocybe cubensis]KAH9484720.1 Indole-3-pyruvate monooxygenase YUCCA1 [Psilocybe cubensis]
MATDFPAAPLPTLDHLGVSSVSLDVDAKKIANDWLASFSAAATQGDVDAIISLLLPDAFWRDMLALTWNLRTFSGKQKISKFLTDRLGLSKLHDFKIRQELVGLQQPYPDLVWISLMFDFMTGVGGASGIARLVPTPNGEWKAHVVFTNLENLTGFPEKSGPLRDQDPNHGRWESERQREVEFLDKDPTVLIIGAGQSGLEVAARLKVLDVSALIIDKNPRVGDNWRNRYEALCLHDPVWYDHMPFIPFPATWPVYAPAKKLANWLEFYADAMELNVWTSANITETVQDPSTNKWKVTIKRQDGTERKLVVNHIVFCTGLSGPTPNTPVYPGMDTFKGQILHSSQHKRALDHAGKKVIIVGACTSAHDIAVDYYDHGVGGYCEGGPPADIVDRMSASFPHHMAVGLNQRAAKQIADLDKDLLDSLHKVGFRTNMGILDTGFGLLAWSKAGGYYLDTGASKLIADGKIKLKSDSQISHFTETGLKFENGTELAADVVIFATGLGDCKEHVARVCGEEVAKKCKPIWGLDKEGELNGTWKGLGVPGLWYMMGNLALCRFHSTHLTLQIKAIEEGIFGTRYEAD